SEWRSGEAFAAKLVAPPGAVAIPRALDAAEEVVADLALTAVAVQGALDATVVPAMWQRRIGAIPGVDALDAGLYFPLGHAGEPRGAMGLIFAGDLALRRRGVAVGNSCIRRFPPDSGGTARLGIRRIHTVRARSTADADGAIADRSRAFADVLFRFRSAANTVLRVNRGRTEGEIPRLGIEAEASARAVGPAQSGSPGPRAIPSRARENSTRTLMPCALLKEVELLPAARQREKGQQKRQCPDPGRAAGASQHGAEYSMQLT